MRAMTKRRRALIAAEQTGRLPAAYQELAWIRSNGYQYITLPIKCNQVSRVTAQFFYTRQNSSISSIVSFFDGDAGRWWFPVTYYDNPNTDNGAAFLFGSETISTTWGFSRVKDASIFADVSCTPGRTATGTFNGVTAAGGTVPSFSGYVSILHKESFWKQAAAVGEIVLFDLSGNPLTALIPASRKADGKPGMYDAVNRVFYTNAGAGEFTAGPNVTA